MRWCLTAFRLVISSSLSAAHFVYTFPIGTFVSSHAARFSVAETKVARLIGPLLFIAGIGDLLVFIVDGRVRLRIFAVCL